MGLVRLKFRGSVAHVRTARLVAVSVARRAGFDEPAVEGVRQAVGEACALTLRHLDGHSDVTMTMDDDPEPSASFGRARLVVTVRPVAVPTRLATWAESPPGWEADLGLAVLTGLTDAHAFEHDEQGSSLSLAWTR